MVSYLHRFFTRKTNMAVCLEGIRKSLVSLAKKPNPTDFGIVVLLCNQATPFIKYYLSKYSGKLFHEKRELIEQILHLFKELKKGADKNIYEQCKDFFGRITYRFALISQHGQVYLLRHPDKPSKEDKKESPLMSISAKGLKQAKQIANMIADEALLIPKPIELHLFASDLPRTKIVASCISHLTHFITAKYHKEIRKFKTYDYKPLSFSHYPKEFIDAMSSDLRKNPVLALKRWKKGYYKEFKDPGFNNVREGYKRFVLESAAKVKNTGDAYKIYIGTSHNLCIDTFLMDYAPNIRTLINTTEFFKVEFNKGYYRGKWFDI